MSTLDTYKSIEEGIKSFFGELVTIKDESYVSGGDINEAKCLKLSNGERIFVKSNSFESTDFFAAEELGISAIAATDTIQVPKLLFRGKDESTGKSFLAMEYISGADRVKSFWEGFGQNLAAMHMTDTGSFVSDAKFGFDTNNFIGASFQLNTPRDSWIDFFRECRLDP